MLNFSMYIQRPFSIFIQIVMPVPVQNSYKMPDILSLEVNEMDFNTGCQNQKITLGRGFIGSVGPSSMREFGFINAIGGAYKYH